MILSNVEIINCLQKGIFSIHNLSAMDATKAPFNTSSVDFRLGYEILVPKTDSPVQLDLRKPGIADYLQKHSDIYKITDTQPFSLEPGHLVLANTFEKVDFPIVDQGCCYSARIEGKSSIARCGILVHFTAPTIHAGFSGPITLEMCNLGAYDFLLSPLMYICQLIIEEVKGSPLDAPNQFKNQVSPSGTK